MNYIWDLLIRAEQQQIDSKELRFIPAKDYSPYMELSPDDLNLTELEDFTEVEVNPYYRFYKIFKDLFHPDYLENLELRETLFDLLIHYLGELDFLQGISRYNFYMEFIDRDIKAYTFGQTIKSYFEVLTKSEKNMIFDGMLNIYKSGASILVFRKMMKGIFPNSIIYLNCRDKKEVLIYLGCQKNHILEAKVSLIRDMFLPLGFEVVYFFEKHFGILGVAATMDIDNMVLY